MVSQLILLSGPIAAGKSTLAESLAESFNVQRYKTHELIQRRRGTSLDRAALQRAGNALDKQTRGKWIAEDLTAVLTQLSQGSRALVDSVRIKSQVEELRRAFGPVVIHVHLTAPEAELARRYRTRRSTMRELKSYREARSDPTEQHVESLCSLADIVIDTSRCTPSDVVVRVAARLGLYGKQYERLVDVLIGGQYGSEGKGQIAAHLAPEYDVLVRVGGPNAGHKVYEEPKPHTFHHLPSGSFRNPHSQIVLGAGAVIYPPKLMEELLMADVDATRLAIDPKAMVITDADKRAEAKLVKSIGSTGQGVGYATARKILRTAAKPKVVLAKDTKELKRFIKDSLRIFDDAFSSGKRVFLEGTQGTGLSLHHGTYPHVTSRDTSVGGCLGESGIAPSRVRRTIMVCRTYPIRVASPVDASSGHLNGELSWKQISKRSGIPEAELTKSEHTTTTNKLRRVGEFDWELVRKAASINAPTDIALTFIDYLTARNRMARRFDQLSPDSIQFVEEIERVTLAPVSLIATRFAFRSVIDRRLW